MQGRKFSIKIGGEDFTLWHGFVNKGLGEAAADWRWWKDDLLDADSEIGTVFVKTRASPEATLTVHDVTKKTPDGNLVIRTYATERLKSLLTANKTAVYAAEFDKLLCDLVAEANEIKDYDGEHITD